MSRRKYDSFQIFYFELCGQMVNFETIFRWKERSMSIENQD